jgi:prepilin-type N-terminal cleavage/methylation domain-containing protein/prepilin-type processing-associated H-X9-DG protein
MSMRRAFTLVELMITIGIIVLLAAIILPAIRGARRAAITTRCLDRMRQLELAHTSYALDHRGYFVDVGLSHDPGADDNEGAAWINTLREYWGGPRYREGENEEEEDRRYRRNEQLVRSPLDTSSHWSREEGGEGIPVAGWKGRYRRTSYGCNNYLSRSYSPELAITGQATDRLSKVKNPAATVHFLIMAFEEPEEGPPQGYPGADHVHVENWRIEPARVAAAQTQTNAVKGPRGNWDARSNYTFLDGHVETLPFAAVYLDRESNRFDPGVSWQWTIRRELGDG